MNKKLIAQKLGEAHEILQSQEFACKNDAQYPIGIDAIEIDRAKSLLGEVELLLNAETQTTVKKPEA